MRIRALRIAGATRTRASVIEAELQEAYAAETFEEVVLALHGAVSRLQKTGVFRSVTIDMEGSRNASERDVTDLVVTVEEKGLFGVQANLPWGNHLIHRWEHFRPLKSIQVTGALPSIPATSLASVQAQVPFHSLGFVQVFLLNV